LAVDGCERGFERVTLAVTLVVLEPGVAAGGVDASKRVCA
jgi:hypothetical protein